MKLLIKGGEVVDPSSNREGNFDVLIENGRVVEVAEPGMFSSISDLQIIDAKDKWVTPGLIDPHVHLREPGEEWKETIESGTRAAVLGGFTSVCCIPNTKPVNDDASVTELILEKAQQAGFARVHPMGAVSIGIAGKEMAHLENLAEAGCVAFTDDGLPVATAGLMRRALEWCSQLDMPIACHQEEMSLTPGGVMNESDLSFRLGLKGMPGAAEDITTARDIELSRLTGGQVHFLHVSTARSVTLIRRAKADGINVTGEVCPHHLYLTEDSLETYDTNYKMSPPLRSKEDQAALWEGLIDGTLDLVASDHAPHHFDSKNVEFENAPMGILGLQTSLPLMLEAVRDNKISRLRLIQALSTKASEIYRLGLGTLAKNAIADITIIDPNFEYEFCRKLNASKSINSPFFGMKLKGIASDVIVGGQIVVKDREVVNV
ncbi:MAG: dihydroorotase [Bdellovibrionota bacterium]